MRWVPRSLGARLAIALLVAVAGIALLDHFVWLHDATAAVRAAPARIAPPVAAPITGLLPVAGEILLALRIEAVPADAAPVVQVLADGGFAVLRALPVATAGAVTGPCTPAILLPGPVLSRFDPAARATLVEVISRFATERPVRLQRVRAVGFRCEAAELARLLAWAP